MTELKVYQALGRAFREEDVDVVFGLMGDGNMLWMTDMAEADGISVIHARHENAAVAMADGYAQASGGVGVCSVTCGPGITQIPSSLTSAVRHGTPLVVFAGDTPRGSRFHLQQFDPGPLVTSTGAKHIPLRTADSIADDVQEAFYLARHHRTPVVLTAPYDMQEQTYPWEWTYEPSSKLLPTPQKILPDPNLSRSVVQAIVEARRPVLLCGRGAIEADARDSITELADRIGALVATTLRAKGWFGTAPYNLGVVGSFASPTARKLLADADLVLAFGAGLGYYTSEGGYLFPNAKVVQVDLEPQGLKEGVPVAEVHVQADADLVAKSFNDLLVSEDYSSAGWRTDEVRDQLEGAALNEPAIDLAPGTVDPRRAMEQIDAAIPTDWIVVVGAGHFWNFAVQYLTQRSPDSYIFTAIDFGVVGQGLATAIGAAVARPDRKVALIEGDGSILMNIQELETMARHNIVLAAYVLNDGAYGAEVHKLEAMGVSGREAIFGAPDLAGVAEAFGLEGVRVDVNNQQIVSAEESIVGGKSVVVDVHISPTVRSAQYRRVFFGEEV